MATRIQLRRGTAVEWSSTNPVLADGEAGFERDTGVLKFGNGTQSWNDLKPVNVGLHPTNAQFAQLLNRVVALEAGAGTVPTNPSTPPVVGGSSRAMGTGVASVPAPPMSGDWQVVFIDNFTGTALDTTKWSVKEPWETAIGYTKTGLPVWFPASSPLPASVLEVKNGMLILKTRRQQLAGQPSNLPFTGVALNTRDKFALPSGDAVTTYTEVRYNVPSGKGIWSAPLWLLGAGTAANAMEWPKSGEIDLPEFSNNSAETGQLFQTVHWNDPAAAYASTSNHVQAFFSGNKDAAAYLNTWRTMGLLRTGNKLYIYDNGVLVKTWTRGELQANGSPLPDYLFNYPQLLMIDLKMGGWAGGGYTQDQYEEGDMGIDYVVSYKLNSGTITLPSGPSTPLTGDNDPAADFYAAGNSLDPLVFRLQPENDATITNVSNKVRLQAPSANYGHASFSTVTTQNGLGEFSGVIDVENTLWYRLYVTAFGDQSEPWAMPLSNSYGIDMLLNGTVRFLKTVGWDDTVLGTLSQSAFAVGNKIRWAISRTNAGVQFYLWRNGEARPTTPTFSSTDTAFLGGRMRVSVQGDNAAGVVSSYANDWLPSGTAPTGPPPYVTTTPPQGGSPTPVMTWLSGASLGNPPPITEFAAWRGRQVQIIGSFDDQNEAPIETYSIAYNEPGYKGPYADWAGPMDLAVGSAFGWDGSWAAAATGAYDARWTTSLQNIKARWNRIQRGQLYIRFAHEMNGSWYPWNVNQSKLADFKTAWARYRALQKQIMPEAKLVFCLNRDSSPSGMSGFDMWPGNDLVDIYSVDYYNQWPQVTTQAQWDAELNYAGRGIESHRQFAASVGKPMALSEWGNNGSVSDGWGEAPLWLEKMYGYLVANAGTTAGKILYECYFNPTGAESAKWEIWPGGVQPNTAAKYRTMFSGGAY